MRDWKDLRQYFRAMADPRRMRMVAEISTTPDIGVKELCLRLKASQPLVSWHLRVLVRCGLVTTRRRGREVNCTVNRHAFSAYQKRLGQLLGEATVEKAVPAEDAVPRIVRAPSLGVKA